MKLSSAIQRYFTGIAPNSLHAYLLAAAGVATVFAIRLVVGFYVEGVVPLSVFYPAVFFAAFFGGLGPAVFAIFAGAFLGWWAFMPPAFGFAPLKSTQLVNVIYFLIGAAIVAWGTNYHRTVARRLEEQEALRALAVDELSHRLKNKLATLQTIIGFQLREHPELHQAINARIAALAGTDDLLMQANGKGAHLHDIFRREAGPYDLSRVSISGPEAFLPPQLALLMTLSAHELCTNAAKYGSLSTPEGHLVIAWTRENERLNLIWQESGGPAVSPPSRKGFGTRLLSRALGAFDGDVELAFDPHGLIARMSLRIPHPAPPVAPLNPPRAHLAHG